MLSIGSARTLKRKQGDTDAKILGPGVKMPGKKAGADSRRGGRGQKGSRIERLISGAFIAFCLVAVFSLIVNLLFLTIPLYMMQVADRVLVSQSRDTLLMLSVVAVGALVVLGALDFFRRMILARIGTRVEAKLGGPVLAASVDAKLANQSSGNDSQALRDLSSVRSFLSSPTVPMMLDLPLAPVYILVVILIHPVLGLLCASGAAILFVLAVLNQRGTDGIFSRAGRYSRGAYARAEAHLRNAEAIKSMGMTHDCVKVWGEANAAALVAQGVAGSRNAMVSSVSKFSRLLLQLSILGIGAYLALYGEITAGMMIAASIVGGRALQPIEGAIEGWRNFVHAREAFGRVRKLLDSYGQDQKKTKMPTPKGAVSVVQAWYVTQAEQEPILRNLSFDVDAGNVIGVVGPTGAGKSTLLRMLVGAHFPASGFVRLDGADLRNWDPMQLGSHLGYLPQDVELFPGTIASNIARLKADASSEEIVDAAQFAGVHDLIINLRDGYETRIQLDGAPLSGGQRQRVALARAFFRRPSVVVLDEPDASLDAFGQKALAETLDRARRAGITVIMSTQRTGLLTHVDKVLILRQGQIVDYAPLNQLKVRMGATSSFGAPVRPFNFVREAAVQDNYPSQQQGQRRPAQMAQGHSHNGRAAPQAETSAQGRAAYSPQAHPQNGVRTAPHEQRGGGFERPYPTQRRSD